MLATLAGGAVISWVVVKVLVVVEVEYRKRFPPPLSKVMTVSLIFPPDITLP
jgi:hypothetical protein